MESMRRSEANSSHHPNKVAVNSLATESNKQSSGSGSVNNNNKLSFNQQQSNSIQQQKSSSSSSIGSSSSSSTTSSSSSSGASSSSESKDTNFEYDDNEWDVGGIGDLIIDLDADIEKSSSTAAGTGQSQSQQQQSSQQQAQQSSQQHQQQLVGSSLTAAISSLGAIGGSGCTTGGNSSQGQVNLLNANEKSPGSSSSSSSSSSPTTVSSSKSSLSSLFSPISSLGHSSSLQKQQNSSGIASLSSSSAPTTSSSLSASSSAKSSSSKQSSSKAHTNLKVQQSALVAQLNSSGSKAPSDHQRLSSSSSFVASSRGTQGGISNNISSGHNSGGGNSHNISGSQSLQTVDRHSKLLSGSTTASMSSQPSGGQAAGKTATKMSIDHQATLDKGLKMKIKRTKPGTKTSEAKHEIVKAEQNGTSSNIEESNSISNNSSSGKKHNQVNTAPSVQSVPAQQATKRGSSSHRRDKTRDKTPHSRDKTEHSSSNSSSGSSGNSSSSSNSSNTSNSHSNSSSSADRSSSSSTSSSTCNCSHELQVNGVQAPCTNISCIRNRTSAGMEQPSSAALAQRIVASSAAGQTNSSSSLGRSSTVSSNLNVNSSSINNATSGFPSSNNSGNAQSSISGTPNAPGPPKDGSKISSANVVLPNHQQSGSQLSNSSNALSNVQQQQPQQQQQQQQNQTSLTLAGSVHNIPGQNGSNSKSNSSNASISATIHHTVSVAGNSALTSSVSNCDDGSSSPPAKRAKCDAKDMVDICVGTSVGTITEPDCLGPCEPGTSVTLEGIVWHETEGGVLVVNVTWRGKTYVGTLLDCTRHDWAPPRFCDSPTEELDSRTPKGRGKRGRSAALTPDLSNFTETRSSVHSKLRNGGAKGRGGRGITTGNLTTTTTTSTTTTASGSSSSSNSSSSATNSNTPSTSPTAFLPPRPEKRKSKDESPSPVNGESGNPQSQTQSLVNPVTGLNVQISTKKCKTASPCAISPVLLECPEQDCSKKYKHANGLRYHQSHAHGSGSMDEDSLQLPESPRICPPTTPSPAPATTPQPQVSGSSANTVPSSPVSNGGGMGVTSSASTTCSPSPNSVAITTSSSQSAPVVSVSSGGGLLTTVPSSICTTQAPTQQTPSQMPQHTIPGGSITAGISGQALSQHQQQQHSLLVGAVPNSSLMQTGNQGLPEGGAQALSAAAQQQAHQAHQAQQQSNQPAPQQPSQAPIHTSNSNMPATPTRGDQSAKIKPGVLRFGPPSDNLTPNSQGPLSSQSPLRPTAAAAMAPNAGPPSTPESAHQPSYNPATGQVVQQGKSFPELPNLPEPLRGHGPPQSVPITKPQNYGKQKKNRKSPVPGDFDNSTSRDDVQSPAYSDISDDSTPVVDPEIVDKSQSVKHPDVKKSQDGAPPQMPPLGGYGMYQFYSQQPYMVPPEHQAPKVPSSQSAMPPSSPADYNKNKEPPLDLMTKPAQQSDPNPKEISVPTSGGPPAPNPNKPLSHFYPFNYMPPGYSYNMDPNYGPVSMVSDESKVGPVPNPLSAIKEERIKESPSPHDHGKMSAQVRTPPNDYGKISVGLDHSQMMPTKLIKNEQKDIKSEPSSHGLHPKEPPVQSLGAYPSIYQRHSMGVPPQPPQHMSREEELRRYYIYPDQRRSNPSSSSGSNVPPSVSVKEEPASPSQSSLQHPSASHSQSQQSLSQMSSSVQNQSLQQSQNTSQQKSSKSSLSSSQSSSGPKPTNLIKDPKEEKEVTKIKQEGQKPTMETQGPPPPPTSQYFLHPSYISPGPFGFDPGHPMYRNVLMSTGPYNTPPYHLPMARFHAPEDLSRNPGTKALDALHHAASQYYNSHKIHELSERALKSPTSGNVKVSVSSPNVSQPPGGSSVNNSNGGGGGGPGGILPPSAASGGPLSLQPPSGSLPPGLGNAGVPLGIQKGDGKSGGDPSGKGGVGGGVVGSGAGADSRSPPPQRHVHTHHHTHVGLGYPMYPAPYGAAVLASQQAAAVAVINPFPPGPTK